MQGIQILITGTESSGKAVDQNFDETEIEDAILYLQQLQEREDNPEMELDE